MHVAVYFHSVEHSGGHHSPRSQYQCGQVECQDRVHKVTEGKEKMSGFDSEVRGKTVITIPWLQPASRHNYMCMLLPLNLKILSIHVQVLHAPGLSRSEQ